MTAIEFENISKQYRLGLVSTHTLSHDLNRWWQTSILRHEDPYLKIGETNDRASKGSSDYVWALKDINFKVEEGDVVGIIGKNGAGKSTLLKLLSRVTTPTTGTIRARGRIASLLEVGTGFHQEMTGRENIYLNGAIMGMTKQEISRKLDEIVDFSGCERYLDTPVKRYSSGMTVRLGFAVAAHLDPEILVVDEVLAVGDAEFQKKAIGKMQDVSRGEGRTVLFVSHNMAAVRTLCKSGVVLNNGQTIFMGTANDAINEYMKMCGAQDVGGATVKTKIHNTAMRINLVQVNGSDNGNVTFIGNETKKLHLTISGELDVDMNLSLEVMLFDSKDILIASFSPTHWDGTTYHCSPGLFEISEEIELPEMLTNGEYFIGARLSQMNIECVASFDRIAHITIDQFASPITGNTFNQSYCGSILMHTYGK